MNKIASFTVNHDKLDKICCQFYKTGQQKI